MLGRLTLSLSPSPLKQRSSQRETVQRLSTKLNNGGFFGTREADIMVPSEAIPDHLTEGRDSMMSDESLQSEPGAPPNSRRSLPSPTGRLLDPRASRTTLESPPEMPILSDPRTSRTALENPPAMLNGRTNVQRASAGFPGARGSMRLSLAQQPLNFNDLILKISEEHNREVETLKRRMIELSLCRKENMYLRVRVTELEASLCKGPLSAQGAAVDSSQAGGTRHATDQQGISGYFGALGAKKLSLPNRASATHMKTLPEDLPVHLDRAPSTAPTPEAAAKYKQEEELPAIATDSETAAWQKCQDVKMRTENKSASEPCRKASPKKEERPASELPTDSGLYSTMASSMASSAATTSCGTPDWPAEAAEQGAGQKNLLVVGGLRPSHMPIEGCQSTTIGARGSYRLSLEKEISQHNEIRESVIRSMTSGDRTFMVLSRWASDSAPFSKSPIRQRQRNERLNNFATKGAVLAHDQLLAQDHSQESLRDLDRSCSISRLISFPGSKYRIQWDLCGMILIFFDIIMIPLGVFNLEENSFTNFMNWVTLIFWSSDMLSSFFVGYVSKGETVIDIHRIFCHYIRTWFLADAVVVGTDWVLMAKGGGSSGVSDVGRSLRVLRILRTFRLLRLFKLKRILAELEDRINSEVVSIMGNIVKLIMLLLMASHFIGCAWYFVGTSGLEQVQGENWVEAQGFLDRSLGYRYFTSLHWSLTQFTPASMDVQPHNAFERSFAIVILVFALVTFSSFLSSITSSMTQLRHMNEDSRKEFWMLRRYMREKGVGKQLALRVQRYLEYASANQRSQVPESKVKVLALLSEQLHNELKCAVSMPSLCVHPFMRHISKNWLITTHRLSDAAISKKHLACGDNLFFCGEDGTYMFFVVAGQLQYMKAAPTASDSIFPQNGAGCSALATAFSSCAFVGEEDWVSEQVLWTAWVHVGDLQAVTESTMIRVDGQAFGEVVCMQLPVWDFVRMYAEKFVRRLNNMKNDISDLLVSEDQIDVSKEIMNGLTGPEEAKDKNEMARRKNSWLKFSLARSPTKFLRHAGSIVHSVRMKSHKTAPASPGASQVSFQDIQTLQTEPPKT